MSRRHQIQRQWDIVRHLEAGAAPTLADLAGVVGAPPGAEGEGRRWSESTLRRDLEDLIRAGFPILRVTRGGVRWSFPQGYRNSIPGPFFPSELMALYYARSGFDAFRETPFRHTFRAVVEKVEGLLSPPMREFLERIDEHFRPYLPSLRAVAARREVLDEVVRAADERRCVEVLYHLPGGRRATWRRVDPYGVWYHQGRTLLMGYQHESRSIELFPLEKVRSLRTTRDVFQLPLEIDFRSVLMGKDAALGSAAEERQEVVIRCSGDALARVRGAVELGWLPGAWLGEAPEAPDGADGEREERLVRFSSGDLSLVRAWILSLGSGVEVILPPELRRAVAAELRGAQARYRRPRRAGKGGS